MNGTTGISGGKLGGFEVKLSEEEEDAGAELREPGQSAGGMFKVLNDGVEAFSGGVGAGAQRRQSQANGVHERTVSGKRS